MRTIIFDKDAVHWTKNVDYNMSFVKMQGNYLKDLFNVRGYLYLNQIYEKFGVEWNPEDNNDLYLIDDGEITFKFESIDENSILIRITQ